MNGLGYQLQQSAILTSLFTLGGTLGIIIAGWLMDRWNAYKVVSCGFMITALLIVLMSTQNSQILLLGGLIFLMGVTMNGAQSGLQSLAVNFYPTHSRATGISWMQGIGRFGVSRVLYWPHNYSICTGRWIIFFCLCVFRHWSPP